MGGAIDGIAAAIAAIREGERAAARPGGSVKTLQMVPCCLDEDEELARRSVRGVVARMAMVWLERAERLGTIDPRDREALGRLRQSYDFYRHLSAEHAHLVEERWIDRFAVTGPPGRIARRCEEIFAAGADQILLHFQGADIERQMERFAGEVMAPLLARAAESRTSHGGTG